VDNSYCGIRLIDSSVASIAYNDVFGNSPNFQYCATAVGDTSWGTNRNGSPCDSFYNIIIDPQFAILGSDSFFLSQIAAGQTQQSACVDAGSSLSDSFELNLRTTRTDSIVDSTWVDMGYHYPWGKVAGLKEEKPYFNSLPFVTMFMVKPTVFKDNTIISYFLEKPAIVELKIYDRTGRNIRTFENRKRQAGYYSIQWDGRDNTQRLVPAGVYFLRLSSGDFSAAKKVILIR
jgi:hypothetical protein